MLYNFILETIIFLSLGIIILCLARTLPRIEDESSAMSFKKDKMSRLVKRLPLDKMDETLNLVFHKILRRIKVLIMKADNAVTGKLKSFRSGNNNKNGTGIPV